MAFVKSRGGFVARVRDTSLLSPKKLLHLKAPKQTSTNTTYTLENHKLKQNKM